MTKARNIADLGSNDVIETTSTGVDVTGTVTADGLTLDNNDSVSIGTGNYFYADTSATEIGSATQLRFVANGALRQNIANNGDVSFYEDTGTTAKMVWDSSAESLRIGTNVSSGDLQLRNQGFIGFSNAADNGNDKYIYANGDNFEFGNAAQTRLTIDSSGNVGIGTASPSEKLQINGTLRVDPTSGNYGEFRFVAPNGSDLKWLSSVTGLPIGTIAVDSSSGSNPSMIFRGLNNTERARIDSSGNLLVTKTSASRNVVGAQLEATGAVTAVTSGDTCFYANRKASDGTIFDFRKNGSTVGSIGTYGGYPTIGSSVAGFLFNGSGSNQIVPWNVGANSSSDGLTNLGAGTNRFKDLYLSGDIEIDGTLGKTYTQTSTSGTTSIIDTGIYAHQANGAIFDVYFRGNANSAGSGLYKSVGHYNVIVTTDFNGSSIVHEITATKLSFAGGGSNNIELTLSAFFWDGTNEFSTTAADSNNEIRLKISGYSGAGETGAGQIVKVTRRI